MNVICFGDSNTYGYDPRSYLGGRGDRVVNLQHGSERPGDPFCCSCFPC